VPKLIAAEIVPFYAQVLLLDPSSTEGVPQFVDGAEHVASSATAIAVGTRSDFVAGKGGAVPVTVEVWNARGPSDLVEIWRGEITVGERGIAVGSVFGNDLREVHVSSGRHRVAVFVRPRQAPDHIVFVID
jgi:hypothetical protein